MICHGESFNPLNLHDDGPRKHHYERLQTLLIILYLLAIIVFVVIVILLIFTNDFAKLPYSHSVFEVIIISSSSSYVVD